MAVNDTVLLILEDFISDKRRNANMDQQPYIQRLQLLNKTDEKIHEIMIEMEHDANKEVLTGDSLKNAKQGLILCVIIGLCLASLTVLTALGYFTNGKTTVFFYGGIAASFLFGAKNYSAITGAKHREKRRILKWKNWQ